MQRENEGNEANEHQRHLSAARQQQLEIRLWGKPDDRRLLGRREPDDWRFPGSAVRHRIFRLDSIIETPFHAARFPEGTAARIWRLRPANARSSAMATSSTKNDKEKVERTAEDL